MLQNLPWPFFIESVPAWYIRQKAVQYARGYIKEAFFVAFFVACYARVCC